MLGSVFHATQLLSVVDAYHDDVTVCAATSTDGGIVATGMRAGAVKVWEVMRDRRIAVLLIQRKVLFGHVDEVRSIWCVPMSTRAERGDGN